MHSIIVRFICQARGSGAETTCTSIFNTRIRKSIRKLCRYSSRTPLSPHPTFSSHSSLHSYQHTPYTPPSRHPHPVQLYIIYCSFNISLQYPRVIYRCTHIDVVPRTTCLECRVYTCVMHVQASADITSLPEDIVWLQYS